VVLRLSSAQRSNFSFLYCLPICATAQDREELVDHMKLHKNNPDLLVVEKFTDYIAAREISRELQ